MALRMRKMRLDLNLSQAKLARLADLNGVTVNQIENGRLAPYPSQLAKLASVLGVPESKAELLLADDRDETNNP